MVERMEGSDGELVDVPKAPQVHSKYATRVTQEHPESTQRAPKKGQSTLPRAAKRVQKELEGVSRRVSWKGSQKYPPPA